MVVERSSTLGLCPCFPHTDQLDDDSRCRGGVLGQGNQSFHACSGFGVRWIWCACNGSEPLQWSQGHMVHAEAEDPELISLIIARWCCIEGEGPPSVLMGSKWLQILPSSVSLIGLWHLFVLLGLERYPCSCLVPFAQPKYVLCGRRDFANGAHLGFAILLEVDGCLRPGPQMWFVLAWNGADHLSVSVPVKSSNKMLLVLFAGKSCRALCLGFWQQCTFNFPPRILQGDLSLNQVGSTGSMPSMDVLDLPSPFQHICNGCCHGTSHHISWMVPLTELVVDLGPCLLELLELVRRPVVKESIYGFDVVQNDLITRVDVLVAVQIIGAVKKPTGMMPQMSCQCLSEGYAVSWCKTLCFNAPESHWLDSSFVKAQPYFQSWNLQRPQFELPLLGFLKALT